MKPRTMLLISLLIYGSKSVFAQNANAVNDSNTAVRLKEVVVRAQWLNDTDRYHYNQMKYYVTTILPYLNAATRLFTEVDNKLKEPNLSNKERRRFVSSKEKAMRTQFEDKIRDLNTTQGKLLVKLIARQTDVNIYEMLSEFRNKFTAVKWQMWARLNGMNLDKKYNPAEERDLENIMEELGYPLPAYYSTAAN